MTFQGLNVAFSVQKKDHTQRSRMGRNKIHYPLDYQCTRYNIFIMYIHEKIHLPESTNHAVKIMTKFSELSVDSVLSTIFCYRAQNCGVRGGNTHFDSD